MTSPGRDSISPTPRSSNGPIKLVCFDLGGVIVRICRSWEEGCAQAGLPVRGDSAAMALKEVPRSITRAYTVGRVAERDWAQRIAEALDGLYTLDEILRIHHAWLIGEYPGWSDLLASIHEAGYPTACLSNTNDAHWRRMRDAYPSVSSLRIKHASHLLGFAKPDASIYHAFERETGFRGREILFFDDLPENIEAARACGWNAERVDHAESTAPQVARHLAAYGVIGT